MVYREILNCQLHRVLFLPKKFRSLQTGNILMTLQYNMIPHDRTRCFVGLGFILWIFEYEDQMREEAQQGWVPNYT